MRNLASFITSLKFEPHAFENAARYLKSATTLLCKNDYPMPLLSVGKFGRRIPEKRSVKVPHPLKVT